MFVQVYLGVLRNSLRQLWRQRVFWLVQGLFSLAPVVVSTIIFVVEGAEPPAFDLSAPGLFTLALNYLLLPALVLPVILADAGKVGDLLWSGPLDDAPYFAGKFSGLWLGLASGSLVQLGGWFLASLLWLNLVGPWAWGVSLAVYLLANTLALSLALLLAALLPRQIPLMFAWTALWLWFVYTLLIEEGLSETFYPLNALAYSNIFFNNFRLSPALGLGLAQGQVVGMAAWFLGVCLALLGLAFWLAPQLDARRAARRPWLRPALAGLGLLAALGGYAVNRQAVAAHAVFPSPLEVQIDAWEALRQRTLVEMDAASGEISGSIQLELAPAVGVHLKQPEVVLRLNPGLELTSVTDAGGNPLAARRVGDSVVVALPALPAAAFELRLAWQGRLHIPYTAFEQEWNWIDGPGSIGFIRMPQPLGALLRPDGGFVLRDGDWMPWPWSRLPHLAQQNYLQIRPSGVEAAASVPLQNGAATWAGPLPAALLVFLPPQRQQLPVGMLAYSRLLGRQQIDQARLFHAAALRLAELFELPPPQTTVIAPYLSQVLWSGDVLLVPDGSGVYLARPALWLYRQDVNGRNRPALGRAALYALARGYLFAQIPANPLEIKPLLSPPGGQPDLVRPDSVNPQRWLEARGRWVQAPENLDLITTWTPRRRIELSAQGEWSALAFWLALELSDEQARQADLDGLVNFDALYQTDRDVLYEMMAELAWPDILETARARELVLQLHGWAETVGPQTALAAVAETLRTERPQTAAQLLEGLVRQHGLTQAEEQP